MRSKITLTIALLFSAQAWAEEVLYCQGELATGIGKKNGQWVTGSFELERHTVKFDEKNMTLSGLQRPLKCKASMVGEPHIIQCVDKNDVITFHFNQKNLRFSLYSNSRVSWVDDGDDTSSMEHGTCQKF